MGKGRAAMRILVAEDDDSLRSILVKRLKAEGYAVDDCDNGLDGLSFAQAVEYDGIVLDIMMPGLNGLEMLSRLRKEKCQSGILMLTAKDSIDDRVLGLDTGADDYLVKPFAFEELLARLRALMRKHDENRSTVLSNADLVLNTVTHTVKRGKRDVTLTAKEFTMLEYFLRNAECVLTRDQIGAHVWDYACSFESNLVDVYVRYLRGKIDKDETVKLLHTVRGFGYVLKAGEGQP
jgi:DNA-binding response OmpR family regulator